MNQTGHRSVQMMRRYIREGSEKIGTDRVATQGWAWDLTAKRGPQVIVLALPSGLLVGFGEVDTARPDVQAVRKDISKLETGWDADALATQGNTFAVLADSKSICPLANEIQVP
jgi:hypothetical protein